MNHAVVQRVLIVEDDAMVRRLLARHFQKTGTAVQEAADADQALTIFTQPNVRFDVVVTDVHLPGRTGLDLATELRQHVPQQPIVFVTGDVDEKLARRALAGGKAGYLLKPFEFFELDAAVAQAIQAAGEISSAPAQPVPSESEDRWLAEQRRLLMASAQRPVDVSTFAPPDYRRHEARGLLAKVALTVVLLVGLALAIGYAISSDEPEEPPVVNEPQQSEQRTIYVPYQAPNEPAQEPRRR